MQERGNVVVGVVVDALVCGFDITCPHGIKDRLFASFLDLWTNGLDVIAEDTTETVDRLPACAICRGAERTAVEHFDLCASKKVDVDFRLPILDVACQPVHVLFVGFGFDNAKLRNTDGNVLGKLDKAIEAGIPVLVMENVDDPIGDRLAQLATEFPRLVYAENLLAVDFNACGFDVVLRNEINDGLLPLHEERFIPLALMSAKHEGKQSGVHNGVIGELGDFLGRKQGFTRNRKALDSKVLRYERKASEQEVLDSCFAGDHREVDLFRPSEMHLEIIAEHGHTPVKVRRTLAPPMPSSRTTQEMHSG